MSNPNQLYPLGFTRSAMYPGTSNMTEPNMRAEMINTLFGRFPEVAKGEKGLLRQSRVDANGDGILCPCVDKVTKEADRDFFCPICFGDRFLWDEMFITMYLVNHEPIQKMDMQKEPGLFNVTTNQCFLPFDVPVDFGSYTTRSNPFKIIQISLDLDGNITYPIKRTNQWHVQEVIPLRADNGKVEFWKLFLTEDATKWLNVP